MATTTPSTMRQSQWTAVAGGLEKNLTVNSSAPLPKRAHSLRAGETLVKIHFSSLNPADYKLPELLPWFLSKPGVPAMDFSGTVVSTTRSDLTPGQNVFGKTEPPAFGALAGYAVVGKEGVIALPDGVSLEQAGAVGVAALTAYQCIVPKVKAGDKVLINGGSGGVGTYGIQLAKAAGCHVTATCSGANVELCKSLGADEVIDYRTQNVVETLKRSGKQFDHIADFVGSDTALYYQCHHYLKPQGKFVNVGMSPSLAAVGTLLTIFLLPGFLGGGKRTYQFLSCSANGEQFGQIGKWMAEGKIKSVIEETYSLENVPQAFEKLKTGHVRGKLVIKVSEE